MAYAVSASCFFYLSLSDDKHSNRTTHANYCTDSDIGWIMKTEINAGKTNERCEREEDNKQRRDEHRHDGCDCEGCIRMSGWE